MRVAVLLKHHLSQYLWHTADTRFPIFLTEDGGAHFILDP